MQRSKNIFYFLTVITMFTIFFSCSKSSSSGGGGSTGTPPTSSLFPLKLNNQWNYKLKDYDSATGLAIDSTNFTLTVVDSMITNGVTYYQLQNSLGTGSLWIANLTNTTLGSIDSVGGITYYTLFASGTGDSTQSISSWPVNVSSGGSSCVGAEKLYAYYADTTLENLDGTVYTNCIKNDAVVYNCSNAKYIAQVFFVKQGLGLARYAEYFYNASGDRFLALAWVLESETLN
jgi:hypothetical protein